MAGERWTFGVQLFHNIKLANGHRIRWIEPMVCLIGLTICWISLNECHVATLNWIVHGFTEHSIVTAANVNRKKSKWNFNWKRMKKNNKTYRTSNARFRLFKFGTVDKLLCDKSSICKRVKSLSARVGIVCKLLFDMFKHFGCENFGNSRTIRLTWPSVMANESSNFHNFSDISSSSMVAFRTWILVQTVLFSPFITFSTHDMDFSRSVTLQQTCVQKSNEVIISIERKTMACNGELSITNQSIAVHRMRHTLSTRFTFVELFLA